MNKSWILLLCLPAAALAQEPAPPNPAPPSGLIEVNRIAATVNGLPITAKEVGVMLSPLIGQLMAEFPRRGPEFDRRLKEAQDNILQELIDRQLIMAEFKKMQQRGANLPDSVVDAEIDRQIQTLYNGDSEKFRQELSKAQMGMGSYRNLTREKLIVQAMRSEKFKDAPPPIPGEVQKEYAESKDTLRDISKDSITYRKIFLPRLDPSNPLATPESQLSLAETLADEIRNGADFAELAEKHSQDAFAANGGLQEDVPRPDLSPEFAAILFDAESGKLLGPLEDAAGFTIAKVESIKKGPAPPFSDVKKMMEDRVRAKKTSARYEAWIEDLRRKAMINIKLK
ncbi:peptidylprolyl isomerase [Haloferula chungangensis]|uniref:Peptidylprolyl isomerase n=1 Tax=Haloferula chungangensis TaxID=1048331 RepID=A0ABW2L3G0_9BACT